MSKPILCVQRGQEGRITILRDGVLLGEVGPEGTTAELNLEEAREVVHLLDHSRPVWLADEYLPAANELLGLCGRLGACPPGIRW